MEGKRLIFQAEDPSLKLRKTENKLALRCREHWEGLKRRKQISIIEFNQVEVLRPGGGEEGKCTSKGRVKDVQSILHIMNSKLSDTSGNMA